MKKEAPLENVGYSVLQIKSIDSDTRVIKGVATTPAPDRVGDIVEPLGVTYANPLVLLHQHDHDSPVGTVVFDKPTAKGITFTATLPVIEQPGKLKDRVDMAWQEVALGLIRAVSIGFRPIEYSWMEEGGIRFIESEVYELSLVSVPAQAEAVITSVKSFGEPLSREVVQTIKSICNKQTGVSATKSKPVVNIKKSSSVLDKSKQKSLGVENMATIAEKIKGYKDALDVKVKRMGELLDEVSDEGVTFDEAQDEEFTTLDAEVKSLTSQIEKLEAFEKMNIKTAKPVEDVTKGVGNVQVTYAVSAKNTQKLEPGIALARAAKCLALGHLEHRDAIQIAKSVYEGQESVIAATQALVTKAAVAPATTTNTTWAGNLVGDSTSVFADFIEFLRPQTILGRFGQGAVPNLRRIPFRVPLVGQPSGGDGYWVGEGQAKPLTKFDFSRTTLEPLKVANIAVATMEVIRDSSPSAEVIIRDQLVAALRERLDRDFIDPAKASVNGVSPASILNAIGALPSSGSDADSVRVDIKTLFSAFIAANNAPTSGVFIMSATTALALSLMQNPLGQPEFPGITMNGGVLFGLPVIVSEYVPTDSTGSLVALVNASDIYLGDEGGFDLSMSTEASLQMDDSPDNPTTASTVLVSLWQRNLVGFRAERAINWALRRPSGVAYLSGVNWGV